MASSKEPENEIEVLFPDREITINGKDVTVKEFSFLQGMQLTEMAAPMLDDMESLFADSEVVISLQSLQTIFVKNMDVIVQMMELACGLSRAEIEGLTDSEGQRLLMAFWLVNKGFFANRLIVRRAQAAGNPSVH